MIDEAHSLGIMGKTGKGLMEHFDLPESADLVAGTFSKFAGAVGGFLAADRDIVDYARHSATPFVFSASLPPVICAAVIESFKLLKEEPHWLERLWRNVRMLRDGLKHLGFDLADSETPVIPIMIRDTEKTLLLNKRIFDLGVFASPVIHPGVPPRKERIRLGAMATHTEDHIGRALDIFEQAGRELGVIGKPV